MTGASGNVGTSVLQRLVEDPDITAVTGLARRVTREMPFPSVDWLRADVAVSDLAEIFDGADAVIHLAWAIQPSHDDARLWRTNVLGSSRVFQATALAGVRSLIYASSVGAYSPGPKDPRVDEAWPTDGIASSFYSRHKATVEWMLDRFQESHPGIRIVRLRPALIFKREAASGIRRLFLGKLFPTPVLAPGRLPGLPLPRSLSLQTVHSDDVAAAYATALKSDVAGAFNLSSEPPLAATDIARLLGTRLLPTPFPALRGAAAASWRAHVQPTPEGWLDMGAFVPRMDWSRARRDLGWQPRVDAPGALRELLSGLVERSDFPTPALSKWGSPVGRIEPRENERMAV